MKKILLIGLLSGWVGMVDLGRAQEVTLAKVEAAAPPAELPKFDIFFPGGTAKDLVKELNKPLKGTLNVIIPEDGEDVMVPAFKLQGVNVAQVFSALQHVSQRVSYIPTTDSEGVKSFKTASESFEFTAQGPVTAGSVWAFRAQRSRPPQTDEHKAYRYYQLGMYLEELKIEDIITAIQTGWKMMGVKSEPTLKFHPETKLLVAVGRREDLALIDEALAAMPRGHRVEPKKESMPKADAKH